MTLDLTRPHKRVEFTIKISANRQSTINGGEEFFTMDNGGTAVGIFNFELEDENGVFKKLSLTGIKTILIGFDFTVVDSKVVLEPEILDVENGRVALVLPNQFEYSGTVLGYTYIIWKDGREQDGGTFQLTFTESWLDKELPEMEDFYVSRFEDLAEEIRRRVEEIKVEMGRDLKTVKQDLTTAQSDIDKIQSQIDDNDIMTINQINDNFIKNSYWTGNNGALNNYTLIARCEVNSLNQEGSFRLAIQRTNVSGGRMVAGEFIFRHRLRTATLDDNFMLTQDYFKDLSLSDMLHVVQVERTNERSIVEVYIQQLVANSARYRYANIFEFQTSQATVEILEMQPWITNLPNGTIIPVATDRITDLEKSTNQQLLKYLPLTGGTLTGDLTRGNVRIGSSQIGTHNATNFRLHSGTDRTSIRLGQGNIDINTNNHVRILREGSTTQYMPIQASNFIGQLSGTADVANQLTVIRQDGLNANNAINNQIRSQMWTFQSGLTNGPSGETLGTLFFWPRTATAGTQEFISSGTTPRRWIRNFTGGSFGEWIQGTINSASTLTIGTLPSGRVPRTAVNNAPLGTVDLNTFVGVSVEGFHRNSTANSVTNGPPNAPAQGNVTVLVSRESGGSDTSRAWRQDLTYHSTGRKFWRRASGFNETTGVGNWTTWKELTTDSADTITQGTFAVGRIPNLPASQINSGAFGPARIETSRQNWIFHTNAASNTVGAGATAGNGFVVGTNNSGDNVAITLARNSTGNVWTRLFNEGGAFRIQRKTGEATTWTNMLSFDSSSNAVFNGNVTAPRLIGNADTATRLQTARNITLSGDTTGSTTTDLSGNVTINTKSANRTAVNLINSQSYSRVVIGLCLVEPNNAHAASHAIGRLMRIRNNGNNILGWYDVSFAKRHNSQRPDVTFLRAGTTTLMRPCTFMYNGQKWAGLQYEIDAQYHWLRFTGEASEEIFTIAYARNGHADASPAPNAILNAEINNSINFTDFNLQSRFEFNGNTIPVEGNSTVYNMTVTRATSLVTKSGKEIDVSDELTTCQNELQECKEHLQECKEEIAELKTMMLQIREKSE